MVIEIGKTYRTRDGSTFKAINFTGRPGTYAVYGEDHLGRVTWRSLKGRFTSHPHHLDIVSEAVDAEKSIARKNLVAALAILYPVSRGEKFMEAALAAALNAFHAAPDADRDEAWETFAALRDLWDAARHA